MKNEYTICEKMARKGRMKVIQKGHSYPIGLYEYNHTIHVCLFVAYLGPLPSLKLPVGAKSSNFSSNIER